MIARRRDGAVICQIRTLYHIGNVGELTDGQLLERFASEEGAAAEMAFAALVERHEAMVWRACLAIVRDRHEAEEAFQATLLVLVRKARSLWVQDSLGPWLHQVACRTSHRLRATAIRRRNHERRRAERDATRSCSVAIGTAPDPDRDAAIHEELNRLPEKYRAPVVLCDLEGLSHREAARCLGWPIGTVKSRQAKGRGLLRDRLVKRGLGPALAGAVVDSLRSGAVAAMPEGISRDAVAAAMRQATGLTAGLGISAEVITLTREVLRTMLWAKLRGLAAVIVAVGVASGGAGAYVVCAQGAGKPDGPSADGSSTTPAVTSAPRPEASPAADELRSKLRRQQLAVRKARASFEIARLTRELAEISLQEYEEAGYPRDLATIEGEIKLAETDLARSRDRLEWAKRMQEKGHLRDIQRVSEELNYRKARFTLEQGQSRRAVLVKYTKGKTIKELRSEVEKALSDELSKAQTWRLAKDKEIKLERQLGLGTNPGAPEPPRRTDE